MFDKTYFESSMKSLNECLSGNGPVCNIVLQYDATAQVAEIEATEGANELLFDAGKKTIVLIVDEMNRCLDEADGPRKAGWYSEWLGKISKRIGEINAANSGSRHKELLLAKVLPGLNESIKKRDEGSVIESFMWYNLTLALINLGVSEALKQQMVVAEEMLKDQMIDLANEYLNKEEQGGKFPKQGKGVWFAKQVTWLSLVALCDKRGNMGLKELTLNKRFGTLLPLPSQ
jgi:hypothetical protein